MGAERVEGRADLKVDACEREKKVHRACERERESERDRERERKRECV